MDAPYLALKKIRHRAGEFLLEVTEASFERGEKVAVLGRNGAGKSTLARIIGLVEKPEEGEVYYCGTRVAEKSQAERIRRRISLLVQRPVTFSGTVRDNIRMVAGIKRAGKKEVDELVDAFNLSGLLSRSAGELSAGEARRLQVALVFLGKPEAVILDEATSFLDEEKRLELITMIQDFQSRVENLFFITHRLDEAIRLADRLLVLENGRVALFGDFGDFSQGDFQELPDPFRGFSVVKGKATEVSGRLVRISANGTTVAGHSEDRISIGDSCKVVIRNDSVIISERSDGTSALNAFEAEVSAVKPLSKDGAFFRVVFHRPFTFSAIVTEESLRRHGIYPGSRVFASFKASSATVYRSV